MSSETYGFLLRAARNAAGMSLAELAERMKVTATYISDIERGRRAPLYYEATVELAGHLGAEPGPLLIAMVRQCGIRTSMDDISDDGLQLLVTVVGALPRLSDEQAARLTEQVERATEER